MPDQGEVSNEVVSEQTSAPGAPEVTSEGAAPVTQSPAQEVPSGTPDAGTDVPNPAPVEAQGYTPSYKWKSYDKEGEFADWIKPVIKSKDQEEYLRTMYAKVEAFPEMQEKYKVAQEYRTKFDNISGNISKLEKSLNNGDVEGFFSGIGFNEKQTMDMLSRYVMDKLNYRDMPQEEKAKYDQFMQTKRKATEFEESNNFLKTKLQEIEIRQLDSELNMVLNDPSVSDIARVYDERVGKQGSFKEGVMRMGDDLSRTRGIMVTPREAATQFAEWQKKLLGPLGSDNEQTMQARPKPVMPNIQGRNSSPARKAFKSIADIEKHNADMGWTT